MHYIIEPTIIKAFIAILSLAGVGIGIGLIFSSFFLLDIVTLYSSNNFSNDSDLTEENTSNNSEKTEKGISSSEIKDDEKLKKDSVESDDQVDKNKKYYLFFLLFVVLTSWCYLNPRCYSEVYSFIESMLQGDLRIAEVEETSDILGTSPDTTSTEELLNESPSNVSVSDITHAENIESTQKDIIGTHW